MRAVWLEHRRAARYDSARRVQTVVRGLLARRQLAATISALPALVPLVAVDMLSETRAAIWIQSSARGCLLRLQVLQGWSHRQLEWASTASYEPYRPPPEHLDPALMPLVSVDQLIEARAVGLIQQCTRGWLVHVCGLGD